MARTLERWQLVERSIHKKYRKEIWTPFITAVRRYSLLAPGDRVAVALSGDAASLLLAELARTLERFTETPFQAKFVALNPPPLLIETAEQLRLPLLSFEDPSAPRDRAPVQRLIEIARAQGCGKLALGQCQTDVIESTVTRMFCGGALRAIPPKQRLGDMELIRPLYLIPDEIISAWRRYNALECAPARDPSPTRAATKALLMNLRRTHPDIDKCVFSAVHSVWIDTFPRQTAQGETHSFLEHYYDWEE